MTITKPCPKAEATIKERWDSRSKAQENLERFLSPNLILSGISWMSYSSLSCLRGLHIWKERASCTWDGAGKMHQPCKQLFVVQNTQRSSGAQSSGCTCSACTAVSVTQSRSAAWAALQKPPSKASSKQRIHSRGRDDSDVFVLFLNWRLTTVNNKWEFCPVIATVTQRLSSFLSSQWGCSVSKGTCVALLAGLPRLTLSCDQLHPLRLSQKKICFPPAKCYESAASPLETPFIHPQQNWSDTWPRCIASGTQRSPSIFPYLRASSLYPGQANCICSSSGV